GEQVVIRDLSIYPKGSNETFKTPEEPQIPTTHQVESLELSQDSPVWYPMAVKPGNNINIKALVEYLDIDPASKRKALLLIKAYDELGNEVDTSFEQMAWSEAFDAHFKYLAPTGSEVDELYSAKVPEGVATIHFGFSHFLPKVGEQVVI
ncbi:hypothetical protein, partial [Psychrobacter sp. Rd 27.2]|uniref:hypothetical protein n=1 Tax=Psychrobacter sp. Rd 27.2 TaxID=1926479 RepID=UPI00095BE3E6